MTSVASAMMSKVTIDPKGMASLKSSKEVAQVLRQKAKDVQKKVVAPGHLKLDTRAGVGPHGAFSQVTMTGPGALAEEFGTRSRSPRAPLRTALRRIR